MLIDIIRTEKLRHYLTFDTVANGIYTETGSLAKEIIHLVFIIEIIGLTCFPFRTGFTSLPVQG